MQMSCSGSACFSGRLSCGHASLGCESEVTEFGVSLTLNTKFAGVGILTELFERGERKRKRSS